MELKDRKLINNTGKLPGFEGGLVDTSVPKLLNFSGWDVNKFAKLKPDLPKLPITEVKPSKNTAVGQTVAGGLGALSHIYGTFTNYSSVDEHLNNMKNGEGSIAGIKYNKKLISAKDGKLPGFSIGGDVLGGAASGAAAGSALGPWGAAIGGAIGGIGSAIGSIFSSSKDRRNKRRAAEYAAASNLQNRSGALSTAYGLLNAQLYGGSAKYMPGFSKGKTENIDPTTGFTKDFKKVHTPFGIQYGPANAKVSEGEVIETGDGYIARYSDGKTKNGDIKKKFDDGFYAVVDDRSTIYSNHNNPKTGVPFSDEAMAYASLGLPTDKVKQDQAEWQLSKKRKGSKDIIRAAEGLPSTIIPATAGIGASIAQLMSAINNRPYKPNTYVSNPYENLALNTLAGLKVNPYPIIGQMRDAEARTKAAIDISGGLSGGQRTRARLSALNTTQNNIANTLGSIQMQNNAYKSSYADAALKAGDATRTARMSANQWDLDMYSKAHAARNKGIQTGISNIVSQIQQAIANDFKRRQFNDTMALYRDDQNAKKEEIAALSKYLGRFKCGKLPRHADGLTIPINIVTPQSNYNPYGFNNSGMYAFNNYSNLMPYNMVNYNGFGGYNSNSFYNWYNKDSGSTSSFNGTGGGI